MVGREGRCFAFLGGLVKEDYCTDTATLVVCEVVPSVPVTATV